MIDSIAILAYGEPRVRHTEVRAVEAVWANDPPTVLIYVNSQIHAADRAELVSRCGMVRVLSAASGRNQIPDETSLPNAKKSRQKNLSVIRTRLKAC